MREEKKEAVKAFKEQIKNIIEAAYWSLGLSRFNIDKQDAYDIGSGYLTQLSKEMSYARYGEEEAAGMWDNDYHTRETEALDALTRGDNEEGFIYYEPDEDLKKMVARHGDMSDEVDEGIVSLLDKETNKKNKINALIKAADRLDRQGKHGRADRIDNMLKRMGK